ncbi:hypothetical protein ACOME3_001421 [Neoechinorhynchus agilis]
MPICSTLNLTNRYIASQGPLASTCTDFWQMIYEQDIRIIVMLTTVVEGGRMKCHKYWPSKSQRYCQFGRFEIRRKSCQPHFECYNGALDHRHLSLRAYPHRRDRDIVQVQCNWWPDHGVPTHAHHFLQFLNSIRQLRARSTQSLLVHCSAGIGRTGVMILVETALSLLERNMPINPLDIVKQMRNQRYCMVQNSEQFRFACEAILLAFDERTNSHTSTNRNEIINHLRIEDDDDEC